jgi:hypothetical protein
MKKFDHNICFFIKTPKISENRRKLAKITENWRKSQKIGENRRKLLP